MFSDIKGLEEEIELFRKNMSSSKELLDLLTAVTVLIENQEHFIAKQEEELRQLQSNLPEEIQSKNADFTKQSLDSLIEAHEKYNNEVSEAFQSYVERIQKTEERIDTLPDKYVTITNSSQANLVNSLEVANSEMRDAFSQFVGTISKISSDNVAHSLENQAIIQQKLDEYQRENQRCCDSLKLYEEKAKEVSSQIEEKYSAFLTKLEETNMDQIYKMFMSLRNDMNIKLYFIMGGTAVAVVLGVLGLILK